MQVILFVAADYANKSMDGKLNILGIFNSIHSSQFPARHRQLFLVAKLVAVLGEIRKKHEVQFLFFDPDGLELLNITGEMIIEHPKDGKQAGAEFIVDVGDLPLIKAGDYVFRLLINGDAKAEIPIEAILIKPPTGD